MSLHCRLAWTALLAATLAACESEPAGDAPLIDTRSADPVVASRSSATLGGTANLVRLGQAFRASEQSVTNIGPEAFVTLQFNIVVAVLERYYERTLGCDFDSRLIVGERTLTANFDEACSSRVRARGSLIASVEVEQTPCDDDDGMCPTSIVWTLVADDLALSNPLRAFDPVFDGTIVLRSPLVDAEPMTWTTGPDFRMTSDVGSIALQSEASWLYDRQTECLDADFAARLRLVDTGEGFDDLDERIGETILEVDDFRRCAERCPESGDVNLIYGYGEVLRWFYDGSADAHVIGPRGREFDVMLPCAM